MSHDRSDEPPELRRTLGLPLLTFYGVGTIIGGGFYALLGKVAGEAGMLTPAAILVSALVATFSAFSFAELSARFPRSAGEAYYTEQAFGLSWLAAAVGWMVVATGIVSAATLAVAFAGFVQHLIAVPDWISIAGIVIAIGLVTAWGIRETASVALVITVIEAGGLVLILFAAGSSLAALPQRLPELVPDFSAAAWSGVMLGAYLAFYSFVGFEDMVNVAEEVKRPRRNLPWAILLSLGITSVLYVLVSLATVLTVPQDELVRATSPLSLVLGDWRLGGNTIAVVGMLAGLNGALVQVVMASRVAYGMADRGQAPAIFARVHPWTQTPLEATAAATAVVLALALWFPIETLAKATSTVLLVVYTMVNLALWRIKRRDPQPPEGAPRYPLWLPIVGAVTCISFLLVHIVALSFGRVSAG